METQLCNGAYYTNPFLSKENAEFLIANNFICTPFYENRVVFEKPATADKLKLRVVIDHNSIAVFICWDNESMRSNYYEGINIPTLEFIALMRELKIIEQPVKVKFTAMVLDFMDYANYLPYAKN